MLKNCASKDRGLDKGTSLLKKGANKEGYIYATN